MLAVVLKAPVLFFDTNPVGRVLNRFSRDIGIMDELLPDVFLETLQLVLFCIGSVVLPSVLNFWVILPAIPLVIFFILIGRSYLKSSRDLKRLEGIDRRPVLSHFSDTLEGLVTIRVYHKEDEFLEALYRFAHILLSQESLTNFIFFQQKLGEEIFAFSLKILLRNLNDLHETKPAIRKGLLTEFLTQFRYSF